MPPPQRISLRELREGRVGLVLMGGGAKGAYEIGVWQALWEAGIRQFTCMAGTSVGALNALLVADKEPPDALAVWHEVIRAGVLHVEKDRRNVLKRLFVGYTLFLIPVLAAGAMFLFADQLTARVPQAYALCACLLGLSLLLCSTLMLRLAERGIVIALFILKMSYVKWLATMLCIYGVVAALPKVPDWRQTAKLIVWFALPAYYIVYWMAFRGLGMIRQTIIATPLFSRDFLNETLAKLAANATYKHCSGPVFATLARFSSYQNPFAIHWRFKPDTLYPDALYAWRANDQPRIVEWTPYYINLRLEPKPDWILEASSAIPFAFNAIKHGGDTFVDGGMCDNWPIAPVVYAKPDIIIVVGVNKAGPVQDANDHSGANRLPLSLLADIPRDKTDPKTVAELVRANWSKFVFSDPRMEPVVDVLRAGWVEESKKMQGPDNIGALPADWPDMGESCDNIRFLWIWPSEQTAPRGIGNILHGTMNFSLEYTDRLVKLGQRDAEAILQRLDPE
jgi:hypothetical protein